MKKIPKIIPLILILSVGFFVFSYFMVRAAVMGSATSLIGESIWVKGGSATTTAIQISLTADEDETFTAITVAVADAGITGFLTSDLAALSTSSDSGIALYGEASGFLEASTTPLWTDTGEGPFLTTITLASPVALSEVPSVFFVVFKTAAGLDSDTHKFILAINENSVITSGVSPTINATSTAVISIDAIPPADILAENFMLGNNQLAPRGSVHIGMQGSVVKAYASDGTTLLGQATLGPNEQFEPITIDTATYTSVKAQVNDQAGNLSNMVTVEIDEAPYVTSAAAFTDRIILNLSENVDGMQAMNCAVNYIVDGTPLECGGMGYPFVDFTGTKITIRGLSLSGTISFSIPASTTITDIGGLNNYLTAYSSSTMPVQELFLPNITNISPSSGAVGATVTITGTNFGALGEGTIGDANHKVFFSSGFSQQTGPLPPVEADYTGGSWSDTSIVVKVPTGAQGGPVNVLSGGVMNDMGQNTFFDIAGTYTAKVFYSSDTSIPMPDGDSANIRIFIGGMSGETIYSVGDGFMTYDADTDTFSITGVSSMGFTWAYDITGAHLNSAGGEVNTSATQNLFMPTTARKISGTVTLGASCAEGGQNKRVVVFAMPDSVDSGDSDFKHVEPAFFTTGDDCIANYAFARIYTFAEALFSVWPGCAGYPW